MIICICAWNLSVTFVYLFHVSCKAAGGGQSVRLCLFVCQLVCPCSKRSTAGAINTKFGRLIVHDRNLAFTDPKIRRVRVFLRYLHWLCGMPASNQHDDSTASVLAAVLKWSLFLVVEQIMRENFVKPQTKGLFLQLITVCLFMNQLVVANSNKPQICQL